MPAVLPLTRASLPLICRSISVLLVGGVGGVGEVGGVGAIDGIGGLGGVTCAAGRRYGGGPPGRRRDRAHMHPHQVAKDKRHGGAPVAGTIPSSNRSARRTSES